MAKGKTEGVPEVPAASQLLERHGRGTILTVLDKVAMMCRYPLMRDLYPGTLPLPPTSSFRGERVGVEGCAGAGGCVCARGGG